MLSNPSCFMHSYSILTRSLHTTTQHFMPFEWVSLVKHNKHLHHTKIEAVFNKDTVNEGERVKSTATYRHGIRLQMAESGHEDEHANLLGDEGLRAAGQVLKLGYLYHSNYPNPFLSLYSNITCRSSP